ncbi:general secretion pathway protein K [Luteimonas cucumeris]|uniref:Type II secretion system protein K n=2 Tax=Luteimonas cucumeris TaxID=985012 RepID=A0A562LC80_9GAMM|nr:general secretion pathway protein K [Luteimonas cucumeris]
MRMRGAALLLVLWLIVLLTSLVGAFAMTARMEHLQGRVLSQGVVADQAARAGLEYALTRLDDSDPRRQWHPDGRDYNWRFGDARVQLKIVDESGKIDLNTADAVLLAGLWQALGVDQDVAARLASAIIDWRDGDVFSQAQGGAEDPQYAQEDLPYGAKDAPFESVAELQQVLGMTPELYAKAEPYLTVFGGSERPDPRFADGVVLQALGLDAEALLEQRKAPVDPAAPETFVGFGSGTYSVDSRARLPDGRETVLRAVVRTGANRIPGSAYTALRWEEGATPR